MNPMRLRLSTSRLTRNTEKLVDGSLTAWTSSVCIDNAPTCQAPLRPSTRAPPIIGTTTASAVTGFSVRPIRRL